MPRIAILRPVLIIGSTLPFIVSPNLVQARGGFGGFHGAGFHMSRLAVPVAGAMGGYGGFHPGGSDWSHWRAAVGRPFNYGSVGRGRVGGFHPAGAGGFHPSLAGLHAGGFSSFHPALSGLRAGAYGGINTGGYGGIHTGGRMIGAAYGRVHYQPSVGYYHPNAPAAAALGNYLNYQMTYDSLNPYYADPYFHGDP